MPKNHNLIIIIDFGSQYTHLVARRVRELGIKSVITQPNNYKQYLKFAKGIIFSGGPQSVLTKNSPKINKSIFKLGLPILGLCYGHQLIAKMLGGQLIKGQIREYGESKIILTNTDKARKFFNKLPARQIVWMSHGDSVISPPAGFSITATSADCPVVAMANHSKDIYGLQFHPEVVHTNYGVKMLSNFVSNICRAQPDWRLNNIKNEIILNIRNQAKGRKVFMLISGGVDSTVAFVLLAKALGQKNVYGLHIDSGLMRQNESDKVEKLLYKTGFKNLHMANAKYGFLKALKNITDPEIKRQIIGEEYLQVAEKTMSNLKLDPRKWLLGQGTIYPDTIETGGTANSAIIKTHHNRIPRLQKMIKQGLVIEPLKDLYKDEVRYIGRALGLSKNLIQRHPFPGPGLAIRLICSQKKSTLNRSDKLLIKKIRHDKELKVHTKINISLLPVRSVGVQGDERSYARALVISGPYNWSVLRHYARYIPARYHNINRLLWLVAGDIRSLEHSSLVKSQITEERLVKLQQIDSAVWQILKKQQSKIWQMPVILVPFDFGEAVVIRPVMSEEAMTVKPFKIPNNLINQLKVKLHNMGIYYVFLDITDKPPATIEWE
ncbi:glutamine-hydrolyzing GMP synthase [Patescibacteria group bacterium]